ncbi:MAG: alpha/beta hydrolase domain-containing protein [Rhizobacter sp.]
MTHTQISIGRRLTLILALAASLVTACGGGGGDNPASYNPRFNASAVPAATVSGPIKVNVPLGDPSHDYPQLATQADLAANGYVEEEYFFEGTANRYDLPTDTSMGAVASSGHPYKSRMIVRRPTDGARFNGVVVVEWVNVTSGYNLDALWQSSSAHFMRSGYAYVGVSAQRVGIHQAGTGLKSWGPTRYAALDVTSGGTVNDDSLSYDVFAQAAKAIGAPKGVDPLGGLPGRRTLIASGVSQSEGRLVSYYNGIEPLHKLFDGYYLFLGLGGQLRTDLDVKVLKINTENDVLLLGEARARQNDSDRLRTWEVAGASHVSYPSTLVRAPILQRDALPPINPACDKPALSHVPVGNVLIPGYDHLVRWVQGGTPPPTSPRIELETVGTPAPNATPAVARRDARGNALGGIRLAEIAVPTATNTGVNSGSGFCILYGTHEPFDAATVKSLYPTHAAYVAAVTAVTLGNLDAGFILRPEADATIAAAAASSVGN